MYLVRSARTDGSSFDIVSRTDSWDKAYDTQVRLYYTAVEYASGGGARFQAMLDMMWGFKQELKELQPKENDAVSSSDDDGIRIVNAAHADGGIGVGLALLANFLAEDE